MRQLFHGIAIAGLLAGCAAQGPEAAQEEIASEEVDLAAIERSRLNAFVEGDWELLDQLHAEDFQLINPAGRPYTKAEYLDPMTAGEFRYIQFEPVGEIRASVSGNAGAVRYRSQLSVRVGDLVLEPTPHYHTDYYERRDGRWQVVFSQATGIQSPAE